MKIQKKKKVTKIFCLFCSCIHFSFLKSIFKGFVYHRSARNFLNPFYFSNYVKPYQPNFVYKLFFGFFKENFLIHLGYCKWLPQTT